MLRWILSKISHTCEPELYFDVGPLKVYCCHKCDGDIHSATLHGKQISNGFASDIMKAYKELKAQDTAKGLTQ